jgi:hypothetical protein
VRKSSRLSSNDCCRDQASHPHRSKIMVLLGKEILAVGVNMLVVPEFGQGSKHFGGCCNAGFDVIVISEAVRYIGSEVLELLGVCHNSVFHIY